MSASDPRVHGGCSRITKTIIQQALALADTKNVWILCGRAMYSMSVQNE